MNLKDITDRAKKLLNNPDLQRAKQWTTDTSKKLRENLAQAGNTLAKQLAAQDEDDLKELKRQLNAMQAKSEQSET